MARNALDRLERRLTKGVPLSTEQTVSGRKLARVEKDIRDIAPFFNVFRRLLTNVDASVGEAHRPPAINGRCAKGVIRVFISHTSEEKPFARKLGHSLRGMGFDIWLDEWRIKVGQLITKEIQDGLRSSRFVVVVLSKRAVRSKWVEREWMAKYWGQVTTGRVMVLPVLLEKCDIPELLRGVKYADFRADFSAGIAALVDAMS